MSVNIIESLPIEIPVGGIVPYLNDRDTLRMLYTSWTCHRIICLAAGHEQIDFDLDNKETRIKFEENDLKSLLLLKKKIEKFKRDRMLFLSISVTRSFAAKDEGEKWKDDIYSLCEYAIEKQSPGNILPIIFFDYSCKQLNETLLNAALEVATHKITRGTLRISLRVTRAVLMHPKSNQISPIFLADALNNMIETDDQNLIQRFIKHPKMSEVGGQDFARILETAIKNDNDEILLKLLKLSNLYKIPGSFFDRLVIAAIEADRFDLIETLFNLPNACNIPQGQFIRILMNAVPLRNALLMQILTFHPTAANILGHEAVNSLKTEILKSDFAAIRALVLSLQLSSVYL
jgi:hypothetical protein